VTVAATGIEHEVLACFTAYEEALSAGDVATMDLWFADDARTVRFGIGEEQWGAEEVRRWRSTAPRVPAGRQLSETRVDLWSDDLAVVTTLFSYPGSIAIGRQSQTWLRTEMGWRIVHAHVSERPVAP
jgi:ketosteroid isomerase-like protein